MTRIRVAVTDSKLSHAFAFGFIEMSGLRPGRSRRRGLKPCPTSEYLIRTFDFPSRSLNFASPQTSTGRRVLINCAYHRSRTGESGDSSLSINNSGREFPRCCFLSFLPSFFPLSLSLERGDCYYSDEEKRVTKLLIRFPAIPV